MTHILANPRFLHSAFSKFNNQDIIRFFEGLGIALKEEDRGRMFPVTDSAKTVADALIRYVRSLGTVFRLRSPVARLLYADGRCEGAELESGEVIRAGAVIVAVGGCSVPHTGSTGDGYAWAREAGHTIVRPYPTEVGILASDAWIRDERVKGISLSDVTQTLYGRSGERLAQERGDMIITHFGLSGPVTFRISHYVSVAMRTHGPCTLRMEVDLLPDLSQDELSSMLDERLKSAPRKEVRSLLHGLVPDRLQPLLLDCARMDAHLQNAHLSREHQNALCTILKSLPLSITGTLPLEKATVTGGGVSVSEVSPRTMESKKMAGLFFAGEILDVHAHTGGYNITVAFSTGHAAGEAAAAHVQTARFAT